MASACVEILSVPLFRVTMEYKVKKPPCVYVVLFYLTDLRESLVPGFHYERAKEDAPTIRDR